jgi:hypothetical protein
LLVVKAHKQVGPQKLNGFIGFSEQPRKVSRNYTVDG